LEFEAVPTTIERVSESSLQQVVRPEMATSPMELLSIAVSKNASIDTIERLAKLATEMMEREAKRHFEDAMHQAQSELRAISADANNPQTKSRYATYARLDHVVRPIYARHGLSVSFNTETPVPEVVRVIAYASHVDSHTRTYQIDMPADGKGAKGGDVMTKTHATGAAVSYGQRYLLKMIFNLAVGDIDDDGNGAGGQKMPEEELCNRLDAIEAATNDEELKRFYMAAVDAAEKIGDKDAIRQFAACKNKTYRTIHGSAK
jgi:hypothetical protein